uniref:F-actin monooxygenase n=1 Tax=Paramormyrops kingsleyae TaxID=1676925 RepID=A0A3B3RLU7_9TELE
MGDGDLGARGEGLNHSHVLFDRFVQASTCKGTLKAFQELCDFLDLKPSEYRIFYHKLKSRLNYWKAKALWAKLDKRASHKDYKKGRACANSRCLIIGAGPCGLRTAIELGFLGAKVVLLEKRDAFSRNNVLHLWPFTIQDLRGLGAKKFYGKFCAGSIDHISIRQLQLMLLKVALLLGIEIHVNVEFKGLVEPPEDQEKARIGWRTVVHPRTHPVNEMEFDIVIGADGRRNTLSGFKRKEFRGKLAIAITANFINRNTTAEAKVEEISGVAFIFNQKFFQDLREATGIDLENIVYYKDDTHYFVMTAKKQSLLEKGVILHDYADTELLLSRGNVDQIALLAYARQAADFSTNHQLPTLDFAINHYGQPDVAMFDFTCMYASENAALVRQRNGHQLLVALVGDSLLEPFWPMGTGIARGFLAAMDSAWMVRSWALGCPPLEVLAERESIYRLLPQTTPENVSKNFSQYSVDPTTRYPNVSLNLLGPGQVRHLIDTGETDNTVGSSTPKLLRNESIARSNKLLSWCQRQTEGYRNIAVSDLTMSWKSGLALCALIHRFRPDLINYDFLEEQDVENNNQLAFDVAEREFGICPIMTGKDMSSVSEPDKLSMVMYLSQFYEMFKDTVPPGENQNLSPEEKAALIASTKSPISFLNKLGQSISRKRNPKDKKEKDLEAGKRRKTSQAGQSEDEDHGPSHSSPLRERKAPCNSCTPTGASHTRVKSMATQLQAKFEESTPTPALTSAPGLKQQSSLRKEFPQNIGGSDVCYFCSKRVYVMERLSAEAKFFHRSCFKCDYCGTTLRLSSYAFDLEDGKFYCKPHYCYRLSGQALRKRPAPVGPVPAQKESPAIPPDVATVDGLAGAEATPPLADLRPSAEVNGVSEAGLAKRLRGTPERIELENYRISLQREEELEEVPEETLAEHNLSSLLDKATDVEEGSSSSESEMEDEERQQATSDLGGVPWKQAVELHARLKGVTALATEGEEQGGRPVAEGPQEDEEEDEEEEDEEEDVEEEESSDEGEYCPWERELQSGLWLESWADEEETGVLEEPCDRDDDAEAGSPDVEPGTELDEEEISSDTETEIHSQQFPEDKLSLADEERYRGDISPSDHEQPAQPVCLRLFVGDGLVSPLKDTQEPEAQVTQKAQTPALVKSHDLHFSEPLVGEEVKPKVNSSVLDTKSPVSSVSPICSQPVSLPETVAPESSVSNGQPCSCSSAGNALSPICTRPLLCNEPAASLSNSPERTKASSSVTSTPLSKPIPTKALPELLKPLGFMEETPGKKTDIIEEFWLKSAEIRRSLGLTPLERSRVPEKFVKAHTPDSSSPKSYTPEDLSEDLRPPFIGRAVIRRLNITVEGQVITPVDKEPKSTGSERRDLSSSSGLGLNGSSATSQTLNNSDSAMLTPPSSPPPPPPVQNPPAVKPKKHQVGWSNMPKETPVPVQMPVPSAAPAPPAPTPAALGNMPITPVVVKREKSKPRRDDVRKSFVESVDEIPFADDVEDTYDDRTPDASVLERFSTPPNRRQDKSKLPLHLALAMENGKPSVIARDTQSEQLPKMESEARRTPQNVASDASGKSMKTHQPPNSPSTSAVKALESRKHALTLSERLISGHAQKSLDSSGASSEGSSAGKIKKRSSLFSPRKNKKEKKSKSDSCSSGKQSSEDAPKHKSLWKVVFSGYKKDKKKKKMDNKSWSSTPSSAATMGSWKRRSSSLERTLELHLRKNLSFSEDSDLSCDDMLERASQRSKTECLYIPHTAAPRKAHAIKKTYTEEELNAKLTRRVQKAARRQAKQEELKRLHRAQIIQRQLEQVEEKQRQLEERGVAVEKALRGEADYWGESNYTEVLDLHLGGMYFKPVALTQLTTNPAPSLA